MNHLGNRQCNLSKSVVSIFPLAVVLTIFFTTVACNKVSENKLFRASSSGDAASVITLLDNGANINAREEEGETPLIYAATEGSIDVVKILLKRGADINAVSHNNETALARSVARGQLLVVSVLLDNGASVDKAAANEGSPLMYAAATGNLEMIDLLLKKGATINLKDQAGDTALTYAILNSTPTKVVEKLLEAGADPALFNSRRESPLTLVKQKGQFEMIRLLENAVNSRSK